MGGKDRLENSGVLIILPITFITCPFVWVSLLREGKHLEPTDLSLLILYLDIKNPLIRKG